MKSDERHELKTNELGKLALQAGKYLEAYANQILIGVIVVLLAILAWIWWDRTWNRSQPEAWTQLAAATTPEEFANVAERFPGTTAAAWARLIEAEGHLQTGIPMMFTDRDGAVDALTQAQTAFEEVLKARNLPDTVRERALFGLGQTREALSPGDLTAAVEPYEQLVRDYPDSILRERAEQRIQTLQTGRAQEFYAWFHQQKPKPRDLERPADGLPAGHPPFGDFPFEFPAGEAPPPPTPDEPQEGDAPADEAASEESDPADEPAPTLPAPTLPAPPSETPDEELADDAPAPADPADAEEAAPAAEADDADAPERATPADDPQA